jgi:hypothetical protein
MLPAQGNDADHRQRHRPLTALGGVLVQLAVPALKLPAEVKRARVEVNLRPLQARRAKRAGHSRVACGPTGQDHINAPRTRRYGPLDTY